MEVTGIRTVLIIDGDGARRAKTIEALSEAGYHVTGAVERAALGLALAAQAPADVAVISADLAGRRDGRETALELMATWGVPAILLGSGGTEDAGEPSGPRGRPMPQDWIDILEILQSCGQPSPTMS